MKHNRRSIRLKEYDYTQAGYYFVTLRIQDKKCLFGNICNGKMILNNSGEMIVKWWKELNKKYSEIMLDEYCVMPNHIHGIINIVGADLCVRPNNGNVR